MTARILTTTIFADLRPVLDGWGEPVAFGVGHDGAVYAAARRTATEEVRKDGMFWKGELDTPVDWLVVRCCGDDVQTVTVRNVSVLISYVQPLRRGVLLVGARCRGSQAKNAFCIDWNGTVERAFHVGDGIQDVRVTKAGDVWVSYFDEGVLGNDDWDGAGPTSGLVAFDADGNVRHTYDAAAAGTDAICDAYAMNVDDEGAAWVYFYTEFPIVRIASGKYRTWKLGVRGARALAVRPGQAFLFGDYAERSLGRLVALEGTAARVIEEVQIEDEAGNRMDAVEALGLGDRLFFFKDRQVLVLQNW